MSQPEADPTTSLLGLCARQGVWLTPKRQSMLRFLDQMDTPFDAAQAHAAFLGRGLRVSRASVYNLFRDLKAAGIIYLAGSRDHRECYRKATEAPAAGMLNMVDQAWIALDDPTLTSLVRSAAEARGFRLAGRIVVEVIPIEDRRG